MIEHGAGPGGAHVAMIDGALVLTVEQTPVTMFEIGDKIGWRNGQHDDWAGTIVTSEPDPQGWHLAWKDDAQPGKTFHWRGRASVRDTRWYMISPYYIEEMP